MTDLLFIVLPVVEYIPHMAHVDLCVLDSQSVLGARVEITYQGCNRKEVLIAWLSRSRGG